MKLVSDAAITSSGRNVMVGGEVGCWDSEPVGGAEGSERNASGGDLESASHPGCAGLPVYLYSIRLCI